MARSAGQTAAQSQDSCGGPMSQPEDSRVGPGVGISADTLAHDVCIMH